jgi:hypothetical protein
MIGSIENLQASVEFASPRAAGRGRRAKRGGARRVRGSATRESAPAPHPRTPNSLNPSQNREVARFPGNSPRPAQRGEADARSAAGEGVRPRGSACPSPLPSPRFAGRGNRTAAERRSFSPRFAGRGDRNAAGRGDRNGAGRGDRKCHGLRLAPRSGERPAREARRMRGLAARERAPAPHPLPLPARTRGEGIETQRGEGIG